MADLWAVARFDLGLGTSEFGELTPALFETLLERKKQADKQDYLRAGIVASSVVNFSMGAPEKRASPWDFVPGEPDSKPSDSREMTPEETAEYVFSQLRGKRGVVWNRKEKPN